MLFRLDDTPYRLAVTAAEAKLADTRLHVEALKAVYHQETGNLAPAKNVLTYRQREFDRQAPSFQGGDLTIVTPAGESQLE